MKDMILEMKDVTKVYQDTKALDQVSVKIRRGEIYGLVGNNGAGKTTLMRLIAGQSELSTGTIRLFGESSEEGLSKCRRRTGVLIEEPGFFRNMTGAQNLEYFRIQFGIPGKETVSQVLKQVGLKESGKKKYKQYSLGMKQRLGIGLALLQSPEFLILDEPINGLDPAGIIEMRQLFLDINRKRNTTILISSHILAEMSNIATTFGFLSNGRLLEEITAENLWKKCGAYLDLTVDNPKGMCILLEKELGFRNFRVYPNQHIHLYEGLEESNKICGLAVAHNIGILGITKQSINLENYYMNIVEGR